MKRLAATGAITAALGGGLMATPAMADHDDWYDDDNGDVTVVNQEKVFEANVGCNVAILSIQSNTSCGGSNVYIDND
ncbi:hypothetical protein ACFQ07_00530 [Actinomadura adrarensis]|uniref:Secreted protein n=1 Tax=Actinomadura adrarensis TaxID=1819600 RepID=A0ABW3C903_9ACTN